MFNTFGKKSCIRGYGRTHRVWKGNVFVRSDNCGGQFKSSRHFRFISEHNSLQYHIPEGCACCGATSSPVMARIFQVCVLLYCCLLCCCWHLIAACSAAFSVAAFSAAACSVTAGFCLLCCLLCCCLLCCLFCCLFCSCLLCCCLLLSSLLLPQIQNVGGANFT